MCVFRQWEGLECTDVRVRGIEINIHFGVWILKALQTVTERGEGFSK